MVSLSPDGSLSSSCLGGGRDGWVVTRRRGVVGEEDGERGDDYSSVAFPGENGHTLKKINCRQHAMVCLLSRCATHTHRRSLLCVVSALSPEVLCRWFGFVESSLENAASGSGSSVHAFPYDIPLPS